MFLNCFGNPMSGTAIAMQCVLATKRAGITRCGSPLAWRHAAATAMLENGADLVYVQAFLGHACITTTAI